MKPGTKPRRHNKDGRCLQLSSACALGVPWKIAPKGWEPSTESADDFFAMSYGDFYARWGVEMQKFGFTPHRFYPNGENEPDGYWIAIVASDGVGVTHAVTMKGKKLYYDPSGNRVQRPHKFLEGFKLVPNADN